MRLSRWRRNRDLNPGTVLPIYELSKPAPSTAWVFLQKLSALIILTYFYKKKRFFSRIAVEKVFMHNQTKQKLADSLRSILETKPLDKVTINDLTDACGVNRQTFYYHFHDIYDLIDWIFVTETERAVPEVSDCSNQFDRLIEIMKLMQKNKKLLMQTSHSHFNEHLQRILLNNSTEVIYCICDEASGGKLNSDDREFIATFYKYAFTGTLLEWINRGMVEEPEDIVRRMSLLLHGNIHDAAVRFSNSR